MSINAAVMSARTVEDKFSAKANNIPKLLVSADSHVDEPVDLWKSLPQEYQDKLPKLVTWDNSKRPAGGLDPKIRIEHMDLDGVSAEVLYPTMVLRAFVAPQKAQEAAFRLYNDWLAEYCATSPKRLFGIPCLAVYDIDVAIKEMHRCHDIGLKGGLVWQVPEPSLPFMSKHYDKLWAAAAELGYPINFHILSGFSYNHYNANASGMNRIRGSVVIKTADAANTVFEMIWSGVFSRHPKLKMQMVESEIGWLPFVLQQWDYYFQRFTKPGQLAQENFDITELPSEIFAKHFYATFMDDDVGATLLKTWGEKNCMWSSDYPHGNMTWPNSRAFLAKQMADMDPARVKRFVSENVIELYKLKL